MSPSFRAVQAIMKPPVTHQMSILFETFTESIERNEEYNGRNILKEVDPFLPL